MHCKLNTVCYILIGKLVFCLFSADLHDFTDREINAHIKAPHVESCCITWEYQLVLGVVVKVLILCVSLCLTAGIHVHRRAVSLPASTTKETNRHTASYHANCWQRDFVLKFGPSSRPVLIFQTSLSFMVRQKEMLHWQT